MNTNEVDMLDELEAYESNLTQWEHEFLQSLYEIQDSESNLTDTQHTKLVEIWEHYCL